MRYFSRFIQLCDRYDARSSHAGVGEIHFITIPSSVKASPSALTAADIVEPSRHEVLKEQVSSQGSFSVRAGERSTHEIDGLTSGEAYDVFFITEVICALKFCFHPQGNFPGIIVLPW